MIWIKLRSHIVMMHVWPQNPSLRNVATVQHLHTVYHDDEGDGTLAPFSLSQSKRPLNSGECSYLDALRIELPCAWKTAISSREDSSPAAARILGDLGTLRHSSVIGIGRARQLYIGIMLADAYSARLLSQVKQHLLLFRYIS